MDPAASIAELDAPAPPSEITGTLGDEATRLEIALYIELERTRVCAHELAARARAVGDDFTLMRTELVLSDILSRGGDPFAALPVQEPLARADGPGWADRRVAVRARANAYLASTYFRLGLWTQCQEAAAQCFSLLDDDCPRLWHAEHLMLIALFTSYDRLGSDFGPFEQALEKARALQAPDFLLAVLNNFAWTAHQSPATQARARELLAEMTTLVDAGGAYASTAVLDTMGWLALDHGELEEAERLFTRGLNRAEDVEPDGRAALMLHCAVLRRRQGRPAEAQRLFERSRAAAIGTQTPEFAIEALRELAMIDAELGDHRRAYRRLSPFVDEQESIRRTESERLAAVLQSMHAIDLERDARRHYEELARRDALTGVCNRRQLESEMPRLLRQGQVVVAMIDLDHFKAVNDRFSHEAGDAILRELAGLLDDAARTLSPEGFLVRLGGEEFLAVAPGRELADVCDALEDLRAWIARHRFAALPAGEHLTVSIGVAAGQGAAEEIVGLLARADALLYDAKRAGRDRVIWVRTPGAPVQAAVGSGRRALRDHRVGSSPR